MILISVIPNMEDNYHKSRQSSKLSVTYYVFNKTSYIFAALLMHLR